MCLLFYTPPSETESQGRKKLSTIHKHDEKPKQKS